MVSLGSTVDVALAPFASAARGEVLAVLVACAGCLLVAFGPAPFAGVAFPTLAAGWPDVFPVFALVIAAI